MCAGNEFVARDCITVGRAEEFGSPVPTYVSGVKCNCEQSVSSLGAGFSLLSRANYTSFLCKAFSV